MCDCVMSLFFFSFFFCSVSWSSRAAFQESPSQWNAKGCVLVYLVRSSELQRTKLTRLVSTQVLFMDKWKELGLDKTTKFYPILVFLAFSEVIPLIHQQFNPPSLSFLNCHLSPCPHFIPPQHTHTHKHTHTAASFLTATGTGDGVSMCHCLSRKWDFGEWMEEFWRRNAIIRKAVEKRMDCYRYGLPLCRAGGGFRR